MGVAGRWLRALVVLMGIAPFAAAQVPVEMAEPTQQPVLVDDDFLHIAGAQAQFANATPMPENVLTAIRQGRAISVPYFNSSFNHRQQTFPISTVGGNPKRAETTSIATQVIPISLYFQGFVDQEGKPITLEAGPLLTRFQNSPDFRASNYGSGFTQFGDAVQRAQFFHVMDPDWHTLLNRPRILSPVTIDVPRGSANLFRSRTTGSIIAVVDSAFFVSQLNSIIQLENLDAEGLPIAITSNVLLAPGAVVQKCCMVGFHTAFETGRRANAPVVQTFVWGSWLDAGIMGSDFADVSALSHEISEWMNDPFGTNLVPTWKFPTSTACQNNLQTGDPLVAMPHAGFPVTVDGFTYHPQNEALLQWFARETPSTAIDGAYSFPDESLLRAPASPCPVR